MDKFRRELKALVREVYEGERKVLVFGEGPRGARVMLVGEAPGEREALEGRPFVGRAGKNLDAFLEGAHIRREELYVTNAVKFRPVRTSPAGRTVNRPPTQEEIRLFMPWLAREIALVAPAAWSRWAMCPCAPSPASASASAMCTAASSRRRAGRCFHSITPRRCSTTPLCAPFMPRTSPRWRAGWQKTKYNINFTPFPVQTGFHRAGNVYDSTCVFAVIRRGAFLWQRWRARHKSYGEATVWRW